MKIGMDFITTGVGCVKDAFTLGGNLSFVNSAIKPTLQSTVNSLAQRITDLITD